MPVDPMNEVCWNLLETAIDMWHRDGTILTTSFAIGHSRSMFAQPFTMESHDLDDEQRSEMTALMAQAVSAVYVGRIDETYFTTSPPMPDDAETIDLSLHSDSDPNIKTAIAIQCVNVRTNEAMLGIGVFGLNAEGKPRWKFLLYDDKEEQIPRGIRPFEELKADASETLSHSELIEMWNDCGWAVADSDMLSTLKGGGDD
jgi:hypothetical protein